MKRVLFISYVFPPGGGAGVQRTAKFVRYLPEYGWLPTVVTVSPACYGVQDASHTAEMPAGVEVIRTSHLDPVARFSQTPSAFPANGQNGNHAAGKTAVKKSLRALARDAWVVFDNKVLIPDQAVTWCPRAIAAGLTAHLERRFDLLYATGEPYSDYFTAATLSQLTGVPFVIDMRDPWTLSPYRKALGSAARQAVERWQERKVLAGCRAAIFANRASDLYATSFPQWADKFHYLPNGYDSADFEGVEPQRFDRFTIVHSGTFLPGYRTADNFLLALKELFEATPDLPNRLQVYLVGKIGEEQKLIGQLKLESLVKQTGYLPHKASLGYLQGADRLLLIGGEHAWEETGKVYEYFASGKPILALVNPTGAAAQLVGNSQNSRIVDRTDVAAIRSALSEIILQKRTLDPAQAADFAVAYERKKLTGQLARLFDDCLSNPL
jgi:glycosyltransferase involved in cell wall biosynthesis